MALKKLSKKRVKSGLEKLIPISPEFYDTEKDEDLVADKAVLLPFNAILIISQWVAFCVLMWWYSSPANNTLNTTIQTNWDYGKADGYNCTPMMKDQYWSNTFNFETCMELAREPKISTPAAATDTVVFDADKNAWKYVPYPHSTKAAAYSDIIFAADGGAYDTQDLATADQTKFRTDLAKLNTCGLHFFENEEVQMMERGRQFGTSRRVALPVPGLTSTAQRRRRHTPPSAENTTAGQNKRLARLTAVIVQTEFRLSSPVAAVVCDDKPGPGCGADQTMDQLATKGVISILSLLQVMISPAATSTTPILSWRTSRQLPASQVVLPWLQQ